MLRVAVAFAAGPAAYGQILVRRGMLKVGRLENDAPRPVTVALPMSAIECSFAATLPSRFSKKACPRCDGWGVVLIARGGGD